MTFDASQSIGEGLKHLAKCLPPIIEDCLRPHTAVPWTSVLEELDRMQGRSPKAYWESDPQAQLRVITQRLGNLDYPLDDHTRLVSRLGGELRILRNRWAHNDDLSVSDAHRLHDAAVRLLEHFNHSDGAVEAKKLRTASSSAWPMRPASYHFLRRNRKQKESELEKHRCTGQAEGERPIAITWRLHRRMPQDHFQAASVHAR